MKRFICIATALCTLFAMSTAGSFAASPAQTSAELQDQTVQQAQTAEEMQAEILADEDVLAAEDITSTDTQAAEAVPAESALPEIEQASETAQPVEAAAEPDAAAEEAAPPTAAPAPKKPNLTKAVPRTVRVKKLAKPKKLKTISGYGCVKLTWKRVPNAEYYIIQRTVSGKGRFSVRGATRGNVFIDKTPMYTKFGYRVTAVRTSEGVTIKSKPAKKPGRCVNKMRIYVTFKKTIHYDNCKIRAGKRIMTDGFSGGYYIFTYKGQRHTVSRISVTDQYADYRHNGDYSYKDAELFINSYVKANKIRSSKKYLIWVSSYDQRLYVFKKKNGRWKAKRDWDVSMGTASTPSPTGNKHIQRKVYEHHGINYWNCFSSWNALHGVSAGMGQYLGSLASHGCIRNATSNAGWIFTHCKTGTKVIIY